MARLQAPSTRSDDDHRREREGDDDDQHHVRTSVRDHLHADCVDVPSAPPSRPAYDALGPPRSTDGYDTSCKAPTGGRCLEASGPVVSMLDLGPYAGVARPPGSARSRTALDQKGRHRRGRYDRRSGRVARRLAAPATRRLRSGGCSPDAGPWTPAPPTTRITTERLKETGSCDDPRSRCRPSPRRP